MLYPAKLEVTSFRFVILCSFRSCHNNRSDFRDAIQCTVFLIMSSNPTERPSEHPVRHERYSALLHCMTFCGECLSLFGHALNVICIPVHMFGRSNRCISCCCASHIFWVMNIVVLFSFIDGWISGCLSRPDMSRCGQCLVDNTCRVYRTWRHPISTQDRLFSIQSLCFYCIPLCLIRTAAGTVVTLS